MSRDSGLLFWATLYHLHIEKHLNDLLNVCTVIDKMKLVKYLI